MSLRLSRSHITGLLLAATAAAAWATPQQDLDRAQCVLGRSTSS